MMHHPPILAVAIAGALLLATIVETYHTAHLPKRDSGQTAATPVQQLDHALQTLRIAAGRGSDSNM
jgi:hypothetical protein